MGQIRIVLLFNEENERQKQVGEYLKTQKRCKTALITELVQAWIYNKERTPSSFDKDIPEFDIQKLKEELLHDENFLIQIEESLKNIGENQVSKQEENYRVEEAESGLDMDEDMMLDGLAMFEMNA